jgi:N-acetylglucosamine kinase-like BadF-type ATPase
MPETAQPSPDGRDNGRCKGLLRAGESPEQRMNESDAGLDQSSLLMGVDGGGTKTVACLAVYDGSDGFEVLGEGMAGPGNPRGVGVKLACGNVLKAIAAARAKARLPAAAVRRACLALAGVGDPHVRAQLEAWAVDQALAATSCVVTDAEAVLAAADSAEDAVALIAGTGSLAFGSARDGRTARAGGWGALLGDEGSAYALGLAALRAVCRAADGRAPATRLASALLDHLGLGSADQLNAVFPAGAAAHEAVAELARLVTAAAAAGDDAAVAILDRAAHQLADMVLAVVRRLELRAGQYTLALAGGVLIACPSLGAAIARQLASRDASPARSVPIRHPVLGALRLARQL